MASTQLTFDIFTVDLCKCTMYKNAFSLSFVESFFIPTNDLCRRKARNFVVDI
jgi:hypothetical protein